MHLELCQLNPNSKRDEIIHMLPTADATLVALVIPLLSIPALQQMRDDLREYREKVQALGPVALHLKQQKAEKVLALEEASQRLSEAGERADKSVELAGQAVAIVAQSVNELSQLIQRARDVHQRAEGAKNDIERQEAEQETQVLTEEAVSRAVTMEAAGLVARDAANDSHEAVKDATATAEAYRHTENNTRDALYQYLASLLGAGSLTFVVLGVIAIAISPAAEMGAVAAAAANAKLPATVEQVVGYLSALSLLSLLVYLQIHPVGRFVSQAGANLAYHRASQPRTGPRKSRFWAQLVFAAIFGLLLLVDLIVMSYFMWSLLRLWAH